jgi:hypothetical protein
MYSDEDHLNGILGKEIFFTTLAKVFENYLSVTYFQKDYQPIWWTPKFMWIFLRFSLKLV